MKQCVCVVIGLTSLWVGSMNLFGQQLPIMKKQPWLGFFSGYERRDFHFGVYNDGECALFLMKSRKVRASMTKTVKIYPELYVENEEGERSNKRLKEHEGFLTQLEPGLDHKKVSFTAETTGDAKVEILIQYDGDKIIMDGKVLDRGQLGEGKIYFGYKVMMPSFYYAATYGKDKDKAKSVMRRDDFRFTRAIDGKRVSLKVYEKYNLGSDELAKNGITKLEVEMSAQEGKEFIFTTLDGKGVFELSNRFDGRESEPWKGYYVRWYRPMNEKKGDEIKPFVIIVR